MSLRHNPEDDLQRGLDLIHNAYKQKAGILQTEVLNLQQQAAQKESIITDLQHDLQSLKGAIDAKDHQIDQLLRDSQDLTREKTEVMNDVRVLQQEIGKLSSLKRAILRSVDEEGQTPLLLSGDSSAFNYSGHFHSPQRGGGAHNTSATEPSVNLGRSQRSAASAGMASPERSSATRDVRFSDLSANTGVPPSNEQPYVEGKEFFRKAKNRLSFEAFNSFLTCIKMLNNQQATKEETVRAAKDIFGAENQDLFEQFRMLVLKHVDGEF